MANVIDTIQKDGKTVWVYDNGMERDANTGRMVRPPTAALITPEKANDFLRRRQELKQERIIAGAAKVLERTGGWELPNELDVVEAIGEAVMEKALDIDNKGQIDAAKFILAEAGLSASQSQRENAPTQPGAITGDPETMMRLFELMEKDKQQAVDRARAVDAE
jgi:hypothetical protein